MRRATALAGGLILALMCAGPLQAAFIVVANDSFESPGLAGPNVAIAMSLGDPTSWNGSDPGRDGVRYEQAGLSEVFMPGYPSGAADGLQFAFIAGSGSLTSASLGAIDPGTLYTLTVAVGHRANLDPVGDYSIEILADGLAVATSALFDGDLISGGTWHDLQVTYLSPASGSTVGQPLSIKLNHVAETGKPLQWGDFDHVRLDATSVHAPEPSAIVAWGSLAAVASIVAWRRWRGQSKR